VADVTFRQDLFYRFQRYIAGDKGLSQPLQQDEGQLTIRHLLVMGHVPDQLAGAGARARDVANGRGQADGLEMMHKAFGILARAQVQFD